MRLFFLVLSITFLGAALAAAPVPSLPDAQALVAGLGSPSEDARDAASADLRGRVDARPWLRRAARSTDKDTVRRATNLLDAADKVQQKAASKAVDTCIRDGRADLFIEWHHFWQPTSKDDLWAVGPRAAKAGVDVFDTAVARDQTNYLVRGITANLAEHAKSRYLDGPFAGETGDLWYVRTDRIEHDGMALAFASVAGRVRRAELGGGYFFALGRVDVSMLQSAFLICDGSVDGYWPRRGDVQLPEPVNSFVVCRGNFSAGAFVSNSVLLVDGDVDLEQATVRNCLIRASGKIRLPKDHKPGAKDGKPTNCTIEAHAKNATAPYTFFELSDVGLSLADDEEGLVVTSVKADTPFGNCGLAKGDLIRAIDDVPAGHSEEFRKAVRRALVRQGDCLLTITRGDKNHDLPVFFPLPK